MFDNIEDSFCKRDINEEERIILTQKLRKWNYSLYDVIVAKRHIVTYIYIHIRLLKLINYLPVFQLENFDFIFLVYDIGIWQNEKESKHLMGVPSWPITRQLPCHTWNSLVILDIFGMNYEMHIYQILFRHQNLCSYFFILKLKTKYVIQLYRKHLTTTYHK